MALMVSITDMNIRDVDLNLLRVFDAVLRERGVTPAAVGLGLTQPAGSHAPPRLRGGFRDPPFVPTARGVAATPAPRGPAQPARPALAPVAPAPARGPRLH